MKLNKALAEFVGAFIGDGCLSEYNVTSRAIKRTVVLFTGSWKNDYVYYKKILQKFVIKSFNISGNIYHRKDDNTIRYTLYDNKIINFLLELGFTPGPKTKKVTIPKIFFKQKSLIKSCLRGIFNTDGTIYKRYSKKYNRQPKLYDKYKVIQFKSCSRKLIYQIKDILSYLDYNPNKVITDCKSWVCRITNQNYVKKFNKEINITHPYHIKRAKL